MQKTQFFYVRKEEIKKPKEEGSFVIGTDLPYTVEFIDRKDSFDINTVVRTMDIYNGRLVVLNDFHEEMRNVPGTHPKTGKSTGVLVKERNNYNSEILLSPEDGERFMKLFSID